MLLRNLQKKYSATSMSSVATERTEEGSSQFTSTNPTTSRAPTSPKKSVSFNLRCIIRKIPVPDEEQIEAKWYGSLDYKLFAAECYQLEVLVDQFGLRNVEDVNLGLTCWGLEALVDGSGGKGKRKRRKAAVCLVLMEQKRQREESEDADAEQDANDVQSKIFLTASTRLLSAKTCKEARARGRQYAKDKALKAYLKETNTKNGLDDAKRKPR
jgi:hypothetical protein